MLELLKMIWKSYQTGLPVHLQQLQKDLKALEVSNVNIEFHILPVQPIHELYMALDYKVDATIIDYPTDPVAKIIHSLVSTYPYISRLSLSTPDTGHQIQYIFANHYLHITLRDSNHDKETHSGIVYQSTKLSLSDHGSSTAKNDRQVEA